MFHQNPAIATTDAPPRVSVQGFSPFSRHLSCNAFLNGDGQECQGTCDEALVAPTSAHSETKLPMQDSQYTVRDARRRICDERT